MGSTCLISVDIFSELAKHNYNYTAHILLLLIISPTTNQDPII